MNGQLIAVMAGLIFCYALTARALSAAGITSPMLSIAAGLVFFATGSVDIDAEFVHGLAEITLVIILFHDASTVRLNQLRRDPGIALRLLVIGFPLAMLVTFLVSRAMFPALGAAGAWLLAAAITPTDAGLGAPTVLNPVVPLRVRRGLNVESGLNDGLATPIVLMALSVLAEREDAPIPGLLGIGVTSVLLALGCSIVLAGLAAWLMDRSRARDLNGVRGRQIATLMLPALLFGVAELIGANAFIAAFVGGLVFGAASGTLAEDHATAGLLEISADLLGFFVWFLFGGLLLRVFEVGIRWQWVVIAVLALTLLRVIPVTLAMIGTGFDWRTIAFLGWFGPRGLATIVFGLLALEELGRDSPFIADLDGVLSMTVLISVFAHGFTAGPMSQTYGQWVERMGAPISLEPSVEPRSSRGRTGH
ncbi:MAG: cation:proton antiporter [Mycobacterium sp.]